MDHKGDFNSVNNGIFATGYIRLVPRPIIDIILEYATYTLVDISDSSSSVYDYNDSFNYNAVVNGLVMYLSGLYFKGQYFSFCVKERRGRSPKKRVNYQIAKEIVKDLLSRNVGIGGNLIEKIIRGEEINTFHNPHNRIIIDLYYNMNLNNLKENVISYGTIESEFNYKEFTTLDHRCLVKMYKKSPFIESHSTVRLITTLITELYTDIKISEESLINNRVLSPLFIQVYAHLSNVFNEIHTELDYDEKYEFELGYKIETFVNKIIIKFGNNFKQSLSTGMKGNLVYNIGYTPPEVDKSNLEYLEIINKPFDEDDSEWLDGIFSDEEYVLTYPGFNMSIDYQPFNLEIKELKMTDSYDEDELLRIVGYNTMTDNYEAFEVNHRFFVNDETNIKDIFQAVDIKFYISFGRLHVLRSHNRFLLNSYNHHYLSEHKHSRIHGGNL